MINFAYTAKKQHSKKKYWLALLFFLCILSASAAAVYFFILRPQNSFTGQAVKLSIIAPSEVISGSTYDYILEYANNEKVNLEQGKLVVYLPPGFNLIDALPSPEKGLAGSEANVAPGAAPETSALTWEAGPLISGARETIKLKGMILGETGANRTLKAHFSYQPESFNSRFSNQEEAEILIKQSLVDFSLEAPEKSGLGREVNLVLKYRNASSESFDHLRVVLNYPPGFVFLGSSPKPDRDNNLWDLKTLVSGERGRIDIQGKMQAADSKNAVFHASMGILDQYQQFFTQAEQEASVLVLDPRLEITATVNNGESANLSPGSEMEIVITYHNLGGTSLENSSVRLKMNADLWDASAAAAEKGSFKDGEFVWDFISDPALARVLPDQKGKVVLKARLLAVLPYNSLDKRNLKIAGKAIFSSNKVDGTEGFALSADSNDLEIKVDTELALAQEARYYTLEYKPAGSGPLPPKLGIPTTYRIYWTVSNTTNDAENIRLITRLPDNVEFGAASFTSLGSDIKYNSETREALWDIGRLQAYSGSVLAGAQAWFDVVLTPNLDQVGEIALLTGETTISGYDLFTEAEVKFVSPPLDTDLRNDLGAIGKGRVAQ